MSTYIINNQPGTNQPVNGPLGLLHFQTWQIRQVSQRNIDLAHYSYHGNDFLGCEKRFDDDVVERCCWSKESRNKHSIKEFLEKNGSSITTPLSGRHQTWKAVEIHQTWIASGTFLGEPNDHYLEDGILVDGSVFFFNHGWSFSSPRLRWWDPFQVAELHGLYK